MDNNLYQLLASAVSLPRLERYRSLAANDNEAVARYFWNVQVSEALLPTLALYEVGPCNAAHNVLSAKFGTSDWFGLALRGGSLQELVERRQRLDLQHGVPVSIDKLVSELMLGFWTFLFAKKNHRIWWDPSDSPDFLVGQVIPIEKLSIAVAAVSFTAERCTSWFQEIGWGTTKVCLRALSHTASQGSIWKLFTTS